jgi:hypothetical protein
LNHLVAQHQNFAQAANPTTSLLDAIAEINFHDQLAENRGLFVPEQ